MYDPSSGRVPRIEEQLKAEVEAAKTEYETTRPLDSRAAALIRGPQLPDVDSHYVAQQLIARRTRATTRLAAALKEFHEFILHGAIPERFKDGT